MIRDTLQQAAANTADTALIAETAARSTPSSPRASSTTCSSAESSDKVRS